MTFALLGLLLLATDPLPPLPPVVPTPPEVEGGEEVPRELPAPVWEIYGGATGGVRVDRQNGGGGLMVGVNRKLAGFIRPELMIALSAFSGPADVLTLIRVGARFELPLALPWKPYLWVAFAHNHESSFDSFKADPLGHLFGLSGNGVNHRSGAEGGLGVAYEVPRFSKWRIASRVGARLTFTQFFGDPYPPRYLDFTLTAGICL
jgi:hypothetical protein